MDRGIGKTVIGLVRSNNEDSIFVKNDKIGGLPNLFIVADGMGGHNAGEVASSNAIEYFCEYIEHHAKDFVYIENLLADGLRYANEKVYKLSLGNAEQSGMGTTFTVCVFDAKNIYFAHVGDSRVYIVKDNEIKQITEDHSYVNEMVKLGEITPEQAKEHPKKNMLVRAVGTDEYVNVDCGYYPLNGAEKAVMCSDGLSNMVSDEEILNIAGSGCRLEKAVEDLVELAITHGGADNISVILF